MNKTNNWNTDWELIQVEPVMQYYSHARNHPIVMDYHVWYQDANYYLKNLTSSPPQSWLL